MIEFIKGYVDDVTPEYIVIDHHGLGYQIHTPNPFSYSKSKQEEIMIYTYQHVREDLIALYGFQTREEKALFLKLLNVTGIGPKGALAILASGNPSQVIEAIENENETFLVKFPGVGKKTARQIILDLKGKLGDVAALYAPDLFTHEDIEERQTANQALNEAIEALKVLGYAEREIKKVVPALREESLTTDQYIKKALQMLLK
ncbi:MULTISPECIES: Holliday junction branch migration protein RuvA [Metabacillus]|jgi:Holliday junction DNA helicase RuvA|uniref:Holliday junction branch migration complex subunit RuvA n=1 Tax=Metabacillus rhizolycopersici TaxID=2875709 RepID=A0ABS7UN23_9BACI|nr:MULTISPECIES: Holliday junction branch migration protein RuvA [Metabacillus]MBZ5749373.1 Holliday junction branch migration protein RuvA [Metabacillus rhizolycopersici]MCM3650598.1 Holliday junction branch migration protein RuvA [Metabacillus litoralis]